MMAIGKRSVMSTFVDDSFDDGWTFTGNDEPATGKDDVSVAAPNR